MPSQSSVLTGNIIALAFVHWVASTAAAFIIGFAPEAFASRWYYNTRIAPFSPMIALTALALGATMSGLFRDGRGAAWTWLFGVCWLAFGIHSTQSEWNPSWAWQTSGWAYAKDNLFGPTSACGASECLDEVIYTTTFAASVTYSLGALLWRPLFGKFKASLSA
jgi:hypothetical protein